jgi:hypothetical protein
MFDGIQHISDQIGEETSLQGYGVKVGHRISRPDSREENIADKRNVIGKGQDKYRLIQTRSSILQIKSHDKDHRKVIVTDVSKGHDVRKPGNNPLLHPNGRMNSKQQIINPDQKWIDIWMEMLDQISEGFVDQNDKKKGRKIIEEGPCPPHDFSVRA